MFYCSKVWARRIVPLIIFVTLSGCQPASDIQLDSATGSLLPFVPSLMQKVADAGTLIKNSFRMLVDDAKVRTENITEGAEKIREGQEQIKKGVRGD
jgi:hypothetical protein